MKSLLLVTALLGLAAPMAHSEPFTAKEMPYLHVMLIRPQGESDQVAATLSGMSLASIGNAYLFHAPDAQPKHLLEMLTPLHPKVLAEADVKPSIAANTAMEIVVYGTGLRLRTKTTSISGERLKLWLGIERSSAGNGPSQVIDRTSVPAEIAYGEAFLTSTVSGLIVAIIPGPFDSVIEPSEVTPYSVSEVGQTDQELEQHHRIIWDTTSPSE